MSTVEDVLFCYDGCMAHWTWMAADAHISWSYEQAGILVPDRIPAVLGGDRNPRDYTEHLEGYYFLDNIVGRVEEQATNESQREYARWPTIYEMSRVMVGHQRLASFRKLAEDGTLSPESVAELTAKDLQP